MCGRYTMLMGEQEMESRFKAKFILPEPQFKLTANNNACPSQLLPVVITHNTVREIRLMRWGLETPWSRKQESKVKPINARSEGIAGKPFFRKAFAERHCLIPVNGFFEWKAQGGKTKNKYFIHPDDQHICAFAGLWESGDGSFENPDTFTIITMAANAEMMSLHERMPCFLTPAEEEIWMGNKRVGEVWFHELALAKGEVKLRIEPPLG